MFGAIAGGIASALAGGAMFKLFGGGQKDASGGIQGDVLATDNNTVGMGDAGIKSAIQGSNVPNPDEAVPSFVSGAMAKAGKGLLEGTFFFRAEDGIRDHCVTGVQTCALPIGAEEVIVTEAARRTVVGDYTREAGVRNLER